MKSNTGTSKYSNTSCTTANINVFLLIHTIVLYLVLTVSKAQYSAGTTWSDPSFDIPDMVGVAGRVLTLDLKAHPIHGQERYHVEITTSKINSDISSTVEKYPEWLHFNSSTRVLSGVPLAPTDVGKTLVSLKSTAQRRDCQPKISENSGKTSRDKQLVNNRGAKDCLEVHEDVFMIDIIKVAWDDLDFPTGPRKFMQLQKGVQRNHSPNATPLHYQNQGKGKPLLNKADGGSLAMSQEEERPSTRGKDGVCEESVVASLLVCISPTAQTVADRVAVLTRLSQFMSTPLSSFTLAASDTRGLLALTEGGYQIVSAGPGSGVSDPFAAGDGNSECLLDEIAELWWRLPCGAVRQLADFSRVLQHNVDSGRLQAELGGRVLLGWYVASSDSLMTRRNRRRHRREAGRGYRTPVPTPTVQPLRPTRLSTERDIDTSASEELTPTAVQGTIHPSSKSIIFESSKMDSQATSSSIQSPITTRIGELQFSTPESLTIASSFQGTVRLKTFAHGSSDVADVESKHLQTPHLMPTLSIESSQSLSLLQSSQESFMTDKSPRIMQSSHQVPKDSVAPESENVATSAYKSMSRGYIPSLSITSLPTPYLTQSQLYVETALDSSDLVRSLPPHFTPSPRPSTDSPSSVMTQFESKINSLDSSQFSRDLLPEPTAFSAFSTDFVILSPTVILETLSSSFHLQKSSVSKVPISPFSHNATDSRLTVSPVSPADKLHSTQISSTEWKYSISISSSTPSQSILTPSSTLNVSSIKSSEALTSSFVTSTDSLFSRAQVTMSITELMMTGNYSTISKTELIPKRHSSDIPLRTEDSIVYIQPSRSVIEPAPSSSLLLQSQTDDTTQMYDSRATTSFTTTATTTPPTKITNITKYNTSVPLENTTSRPDETRYTIENTTRSSTTTTHITTTSSSTSTTTLYFTSPRPTTARMTTATTMWWPTLRRTTEEIWYTREIPNSEPFLDKPISVIQAMQGRMLEYHIPPGTFYDMEDGDTRNLQLTLQHPSGQDLPGSFWLYLDPLSQVLTGLPLYQDMDVQNTSVELVARDSQGLSARHRIFLQIVDHPRIHLTHRFILRFAINFQQFMSNRSNLTRLLNKIGEHFRDSPAARHITVLDVNQGSFVLTWTNSSLASSGDCPKKSIIQLRKRMTKRGGQVRSSFNRIIGRYMQLVEVHLDYLGVCMAQPKPNTTSSLPTSTELGPGDGSQDDLSIWAHVILPVVIAVLVFFLLVLIFVLCNRRHRERQRRRNNRYDGENLVVVEKEVISNDRQPIIFPDELDLTTCRGDCHSRDGFDLSFKPRDSAVSLPPDVTNPSPSRRSYSARGSYVSGVADEDGRGRDDAEVARRLSRASRASHDVEDANVNSESQRANRYSYSIGGGGGGRRCSSTTARTASPSDGALDSTRPPYPGLTRFINANTSPVDCGNNRAAAPGEEVRGFGDDDDTEKDVYVPKIRGSELQDGARGGGVGGGVPGGGQKDRGGKRKKRSGGRKRDAKDSRKKKRDKDKGVSVSASSTLSWDRPNNHYLEEEAASRNSTLNSTKSGRGNGVRGGPSHAGNGGDGRRESGGGGGMNKSPPPRSPPPYWQTQGDPPPYRLPPTYFTSETTTQV